MKCNTIVGYDENGVPKYKSKVQHNTLDGAIIAAKKINIKLKTIHKVIAYKCPLCHKFHIGTSKKIITEKERIKWKLQLKNKMA